MVKDAWRIDHLPASILIVCVTDEEVLRCECIGLNIDVRICNIIDEAGLADIREARDDQRACVCVNRRQSAKMFPHFFKIAEGRL